MWHRFSVFVLLLLFVSSGSASGAALAQPVAKVFYGGFAFAGSASEIDKNYPIAASLNEVTGDGDRFFESQARAFFRKNASAFSKIALSFDVARSEDTPLVLALALSDEKVLCEEFGDFHKLVIQLGLDLLVLDFRAMEVVSSRPICIELIDARAEDFSNDDIRARMRSMIEGDGSQLFSALRTKINDTAVRGKNQCTLQIRTVTIGDKALPFLPEAYRQTTESYACLVAQQFGSMLTSQARVALLPYAKDGVNSKMALRFSDASILQFKIPAPTFAVDVGIRGFKKVLDKSTDAESLWLTAVQLRADYRFA